MVSKGKGGPVPVNKLYYGDNLDVLRERIPDAVADLVYLDPPFNSNRSFNVLFKEKSGGGAQAQIEAFDDTWTWSQETEVLYIELMNGSAPNRVKDAVEAMRKLLGDNDVLAYLVMMTARLIELHRVLKPTGTLYLHCDPTASHYLKVILDAVFGAQNFKNEIIWKRHNARSVRQAIWPRLHDVLLVYSRAAAPVFNVTMVSSGHTSDPHDIVKWTDGKRYRTMDLTGQGLRNGETGKPWSGIDPGAKGRHWRMAHAALEDLKTRDRIYWQRGGMPRERAEQPYVPAERMAVVGDVWVDIDSINAGAAERLGYPTQKPLALLERIIRAASKEGDLVLDPFCGCGTTVDAAQKLGRNWIGIDITTLAIDLIDARLRHTYGESITNHYEILGIPRDMEGAAALFHRSPFEFERWCVMMLDGQPNEKQTGDKGIDGVIRFPIDGKGNSDRILVSVKGGITNPGHVRDLVGTVQSQKAAMGVFISMQAPSKGMKDAANHSGVYKHPRDGKSYPKVQIVSVKEVLAGKRPMLPLTQLPYFQAQRRGGDGDRQLRFEG